jgi:hypothetical protein
MRFGQFLATALAVLWTGTAWAQDLDSCRTEAMKWEKQVQAEVKGRTRTPGYTLIVFMESGEICYANRLYGIEGDPIFVAVYTSRKDWGPARFEPCAIEPDSPALFVSADRVILPQVEGIAPETPSWFLHRVTARTCFNSSVDISLPTEDGQAAVRYSLSQSRVYRGTFQLGALFTRQFVQDYDIRQEDGRNIVYSRGPEGRGVAYSASIVLYGFPHYLVSLFGGPAYSGRDLIHDQGVLDRTGLVLGIGLTDPSRRFVAGGSFELMYGVNLIGVAEIFRRPVLVGTAVGQEFVGNASELRTRDVWRTSATFGLAVDLIYVKELFSGRIGP